MVSSYYGKEVVYMQHFNIQLGRNWAYRLGDVNDCGVMISDGKTASPETSKHIGSTGWVFVWSIFKFEHSNKAIMEQEL